jgi:hypothetical protein
MALQEEVTLIVEEALAEVVEMVEVVAKATNFALSVDRQITMLIVVGRSMATLHTCKIHRPMELLTTV